MDYDHQPIIPEPINEDNDRYTPGHWDYPTRCANIELALAVTRERIEEWDPADADGWWHQRPQLIALHNEVVRLRANTGNLAAWLLVFIATRPTEIDTAINLGHQMGHYAGTYAAIDIYRQVLAMVEAQQ